MSSAQGEDRSDFQAVLPMVDRNGKKLDFVLFKATEATSWTSKTYAQNVANAKKAGVPFGSYHFLHPSLNVPAQVALFLQFIKEHGGLEPGAMVAVDSEISSGANEHLILHSARSHILVRDPDTGEARIPPGVSYPHHMLARGTPQKLHASLVDLATREFIVGVQNGIKSALGGDHCQELVYTFLDMLPQLPSCVDFPLWVADYTSSAPTHVAPWHSWVIWQYAGGGGNGGSDQDGFDGDPASFLAWVNGKKAVAPPPPDPKPTPPPAPSWLALAKLLPTVQSGGTGESVRTVQSLCLARGHTVTVDGLFGPGTMAAVKAVQLGAKLSADGIVGPYTWGALLGL